MPQKIRSVQVVYEGRHEVVVANVDDASGDGFRREIIVRPDAAVVLPYDMSRRCALLVRIPRTPVQFISGQPEMLEAVAGVIEDGEDAQACIRREAMEEAGVELRSLEPIAIVFASPGYSTERQHLFLAPYTRADRAGAGGGAVGEHEDIEPVEVPLPDLWTWIERGAVDDLKTFALVHALRARRADLFEPAEEEA
jgi:nudix-type nucleoside diphosphatase (YffH/AdpP family)